MSIIFRRIFQNHNKLLANLSNGLKTTQRNSSYEGDGKMKVKVLNNDPEMGLMINAFSEVGLLKHFHLLIGKNTFHQCSLFDRMVLDLTIISK